MNYPMGSVCLSWRVLAAFFVVIVVFAACEPGPCGDVPPDIVVIDKNDTQSADGQSDSATNADAVATEVGPGPDVMAIEDTGCNLDAVSDVETDITGTLCDLPFVGPACETCSAGYEAVPIDIGGVAGISCAALGPVWGNSPTSPFGVYTTETVAGEEVVTDDLTRMMWQVVSPVATATIDVARVVCDDSTYGGFADWRLPYVHELASLVDYDIMSPDPALSPSRFPGTAPTHFWTYNDVVPGTSGAWMVSFGDGTLTVGLQSGERQIRCVRPVGAYSVDALRFDYTTAADTALDRWTGLTWQRQSASPSGWADAKSYCAILELAGLSDWRLPSVRELYGLADYRVREPAFDDVAFPDASSSKWWSRTVNVDDVSQGWVVDFELGSIALDSVDTLYPVRCVRGE